MPSNGRIGTFRLHRVGVGHILAMTLAVGPEPSGHELVPNSGNAQSHRSREPSDVFAPAPGGTAEHTGQRWSNHHPGVAALVVLAYSYVLLALATIGIGLLVVHTSLGRRELSINRWFVDARTASWNHMSAIGSSIANTPTVLIVAAVAVVALLLTKRWPAALFLAGGLLLEVTVFVTAAFLVDRSRPDVVRLDQAPPTSSYPSGHTAAAVVLYVGLAIVLFSITRSRALRIAGFIVGWALVVFVGTSRMYRGMHHLSDVVAGLLLGIACILAALLAVRAARASQMRRASQPELVR